ncbi:MFS transporter [Flavobacteriaceae bacterium F89]|uniref:MFS transporter n=1 Tax=Cerina litoralis TaxID=2874477 RepID=A0AAE3ET51_9FLAO|nr:MFS transporter [Cerina litoralis]MCG2460640.1 MFS transporter [Cerina litoralis]
MKITTFNAFKSRNFRLFFIGQSTSLVGTWMQKTAVSWVIYSLTQSKFMLGITVFATLFPTAVFSLLGGVVADRYNKHRVLLLTQVASLIQALLLTLAIIFFRQYSVWIIIGLSVVLGVINGFDVPARQSLVRDMVENDRDLPNAVALNSSMVNLSKLFGPALAGFVLASFGDEICFGLNAISFAPVIISLLMMKLPQLRSKPKSERNLRLEFRESLAYIRGTPVVGSVIVFVSLMSLLVLPFSTLTPVFAKDVFMGTAATLGTLDGIIGLGAFLGAIFLASLKESTDLSRVLAVNSAVFGVGLILFSQTAEFPLALLFIAIGSFGMMSVRTVSNTIMQLHSPHSLRGRIISTYVLIVTALVPIGSLLVGGVSHYIGAATTVLVEGIIAVIIALIYGRYLYKGRSHKRD